MPSTGYLDFSGPYTLTINGTDYTNYSGEQSLIDVQQSLPTIPRADERRPKFEPVLAIGEINLFADQESKVIDWESAISNDLKTGRPIVITTQHNTYRFRVREFDIADSDPCTGLIKGVKVLVTDKLGQINRVTQRPSISEYIQLLNSEGISPTAPVFLWQKVIRLVGQFSKKANDQPYLTGSDFDLPTDNFTDDGFLDTEAVPRGEFNAAEAIASILYARGYLCYCDPADERIKAHRYPIDISEATPAYRWACSQLEIFAPQAGTEEVADKVEAEVLSYKLRIRVVRESVDVTVELPEGVEADDVADPDAIAVDTWPKTFPTAMNGDTVFATRTEQQPAISASQSVSSYSESGRQSYLFPDSTDDSTIEYLTGTITRKTHPTYGFSISEIHDDQVSKGVLSDDIFPESTQKAGRRLEKHWKVSNVGDGADGVLTREYEQLWLPTSVVLEDETLADTLTISYEKGYRYQEYSPGQWIKIPYRLIADLDNLRTDLILDPDFNEAVEFVDGIPSPPTAARDDVEEVEVNSGEANAQSGEDSSGPRLRVSLRYGNRASLAKTTAAISLALSQHNSIIYDVVRPEQADDVWTPGTREDAANVAMIRVGHTLRADSDGIFFGYTGLKGAILEKPITIADIDSGNLPSETNVTPVYVPIEVAHLDTSFAALSVSTSAVARESLSVVTDFAALNSDIDLLEPGSLTATTDFASLETQATLFQRQTVTATTDFAALTTEAEIEPDAYWQYRSRLTGTYSTPELTAIQAFVNGLVADGLWDKIRVLYLFSLDNASDAVLNVKDSSFTATNNSMAFAARQGFTGNGSNAYLATGFNPSAQGLAQNSATIGIYNRTGPSDVGVDIGCAPSNFSSGLYFYSRNASDLFVGRVNQAFTFTSASTVAGLGLSLLTRTGASSSAVYANGSLLESFTTGSATPPSFEVFIGGINTGGSALEFASKQYASALIADGFTATDASNFAARLETALDAFGAGVIT